MGNSEESGKFQCEIYNPETEEVQCPECGVWSAMSKWRFDQDAIVTLTPVRGNGKWDWDWEHDDVSFLDEMLMRCPSCGESSSYENSLDLAAFMNDKERADYEAMMDGMRKRIADSVGKGRSDV